MKQFIYFLFLCTSVLYGNQDVHEQPLKKLPLDTCSFKIIIENNYLYVDKTKSIHSLIESGRHYFLVRPRRFGRTLFLSTLQEIFSGNKKVFADCWIGQGDNYTWPMHPVIKLDFLMVDDASPERFEVCLLYKIRMLAEENGIDLTHDTTLEVTVTELIHKLSVRGKVVLLVDEYDKPFRRHQCDKVSFEKIGIVLKNFYTAIGKLNDYFHAIIITGVIPYKASMLFSAIPELKNISSSQDASKIFGFTDEELNTILFPYIEQYAQHVKKSPSAVIQELGYWYGGYRFVPQDLQIYCPTPVLYTLGHKEKYPYWFQTNTPTFLVEQIKEFPKSFNYQETWKCFRSYGENCEPEEISPATALWYAGYLTIYSIQNAKNLYLLIFPNHSARDAFSTLFSNFNPTPSKAKGTPYFAKASYGRPIFSMD